MSRPEPPRTLHNPVSGQADARAGFAISPEQERAMLRVRLMEMQDVLAPIVRKACALPVESVPDAAFLAWMRSAIDISLANGMRTVEDVVAFLSLLRSVGPRFYEFPAVKRYFARNDLPAVDRVPGLFAALPVAMWAVVRRHSGAVAARK